MKCEKCEKDVKYIILKDKSVLCEECTKEYLKQFGDNIDEFDYIIPYSDIDADILLCNKQN